MFVVSDSPSPAMIEERQAHGEHKPAVALWKSGQEGHDEHLALVWG